MPPSPLASAQHRLTALLTPSTLSHLDSQGYVVIDNAFPTHIAHGLRNEILACYDAGCMDSNHTAYVEATCLPSTSSPSSPSPTPAPASPRITHLYSKPHIYEAEVLPSLLSHPSLPPSSPLPLLSSFTSHLLPHLDANLAPLLPRLLLYSGHSSLKLQLNTGLGSFPYHFDSPGNRTDTRRLTLLLYLNPHHLPSHGGHLLLQPFLGAPIAVQPTFNRLLIFRSDQMLHRVTAAQGMRRCCLTVWMHGRGCDEGVTRGEGEEGEGEGQEEEGGEDGGGMVGWLRHRGVQRALSKCVYEEEWRASYLEAHGADGGQRLADSLAEDVRRMMAQPGVRQVVEMMKGIKREHDQRPVRQIGEGQGDVQGGDLDDHVEGGEGEGERKGKSGERGEGEEREVVVRDVNPDELGFLDFL